jgi:hypothetical protein
VSSFLGGISSTSDENEEVQEFVKGVSNLEDSEEVSDFVEEQATSEHLEDVSSFLDQADYNKDYD